MPQNSKISHAEAGTIRLQLQQGKTTIRNEARARGVSPSTVTRALRRLPSKTRDASEFQGVAPTTAPRRVTTDTCWSLEQIRDARDAQIRGDFKRPVQLAKAMRTDSALFTAYHNRIAPHNAVATKLVPHGSTRGANVARKAAESVTMSRSVLQGLLGTLANHGIAIGYVEHEPEPDGSRVNFRLTEWPLEHVKLNTSTEILETATREGQRVPIVHGDSRWVVFRKFLVEPWSQDACLLPGSLVWALHANGLADWAGASRSHGQAKIAGALPEGVALQRVVDGATVLTPEAKAFLDMLEQMVNGEAGAGIRAAGSELDFLSNGSTAWQVFHELIQMGDKAAARIYQGTDATLGSVGGAPGVDIATLFGVASTRVQGDFAALEAGVNTGVYNPWTAMNEGDSRYAPALSYQMPDPDAEAQSKEKSERRTRFANALRELKENGMQITQEVVNAIADEHGVLPVPQLASGDSKAVPIPLAPTDIAKVVRVGAALRSLGLEPFGDERDNMTITELDAFVAAQAEASAETPQTPPAAMAALRKFTSTLLSTTTAGTPLPTAELSA